jgi:DNA-binding response OmpR family regulator
MGFAKISSVSKILIVEDDQLSRKAVGLFLSEEGYDVCQTSDGAEAISVLQTTRFDLVLADIMMPRVDGVELLVQMRRIAPETAVVLMTGYYAGDGEMIGADGFIAKPFLFKDLLYKIKQVLERRRNEHR